jgi:hypothetical protein
VQLRFSTSLTSKDYVSEQGWQKASLPSCPRHPQGGCGLARHGTYGRKYPPGTRIARWYCRQGQQTFSLLPDCLAARLPSTLGEVEEVVEKAEHSGTLEAAAAHLRLDIELPGALRWLRRRVQAVHRALLTLKGLLPERFGSCRALITDFRSQLPTDAVLITLRAMGAAHLPVLPTPLGFAPRRIAAVAPRPRRQHHTGADPPG